MDFTPESPCIAPRFSVFIRPMKTLFVIFALITSSVAGEYRTWTEAESGKKIKAKIVDKEANAVKLSTKDGKLHWVDAAKLSKEDRDFIEAWKKKQLDEKK